MGDKSGWEVKSYAGGRTSLGIQPDKHAEGGQWGTLLRPVANLMLRPAVNLTLYSGQLLYRQAYHSLFSVDLNTQKCQACWWANQLFWYNRHTQGFTPLQNDWQAVLAFICSWRTHCDVVVQVMAQLDTTLQPSTFTPLALCYPLN